MKKKSKTQFAILCCNSALAAFPMLASAQSQQALNENTQSPRALEEIVVTAQKRNESLQDVPISVVAMTGETVTNLGIDRMQDFAAMVPNFNVTTDPLADKINIRGIQSGNNAGFEQSIGTYVDGVYHGRGIQSRFSFLDMERIEVLRGPQGTLFGKNTVGGALNITTAKPTAAFDAAGSIMHNFETDEIETLGHVSGPITDNLRGRVAFIDREIAKGYLVNEFYNNGAPDLKERAIRGSLEWDVSDATLLKLRVEQGDYKIGDYAMDTLTPGPLAVFGLTNDIFDNKSRIGNRSGNSAIDAVIDFGSGQKIDGDNSEIALTVEHGFDSGGALTGIIAYSDYEFLRFLDADFSPIPGIRLDDSEDFDQTSVELRYASEQGQKLEYLVGAYYQKSDLTADGRLDLNVPFYDAFLDAGCAKIGTPANAQQFRTCLLGTLVTGEPTVSRYNYLDQETDAQAVFGQMTVNLTDTVRVTGGLRYSHEKKSALQGARATEFGTTILENGNTGPIVKGALLELQDHENNLDRSESSWTWSANTQWDVRDNVMLYASATTGNKSGGFNSFALRADPADAQYDPEEVSSYEIGAKTRLFDNLFEFNIVAFSTDYSDLQTSVFTGSTSFIVQNAAQATSRGIEIDARWLATDKLTISGGLGLIDFKFDEFPNAGCTADQLIAFRNAVGVATGNLRIGALQSLSQCAGSTPVAGVPGQNNNLKGETSAHTPEISGHLVFNYDQPIGNNFGLNLSLVTMYQSDKFVQDDLDPYSLQKSHMKVDTAVIFGPNSGAWDVSLIGTNLTDERTINYMNDTPLVDTARQAMPESPRTVALRARMRF